MPTINYLYDKSFSPGIYKPELDPKGTSNANRVYGEIHTLTKESNNNYHVIIPIFTPFFSNNIIIETITNNVSTNLLVEGIDYVLAYQFLGASRGCIKPIYGGISILNNRLEGNIKISYQSLGGDWCINLNKINEILSNQIQNPRVTAWEQITSLPTVFPVIDHEWNLKDLIGTKDIVKSIDLLSQSISNVSIDSIVNTQLEVMISDHSDRLNTIFENINISNIMDAVFNPIEELNININILSLYEEALMSNHTTSFSFNNNNNDIVSIYNITIMNDDYSKFTFENNNY